VPNGATTGTYTVTVADDSLVEGTETVRATISNPSLTGLTIATANATANLTDDDTATATITATDGEAAEDPADGGAFTITLSAPNNSTQPLTITYTVSGSATAGTDFTALSGQVQVPVGADTATITVDTSGFNDSMAEGNESVIVTLTGTDNPSFTLGTPVGAVVVISDTDTTPTSPDPEPQPEPTEEAPAEEVAEETPPVATDPAPADDETASPEESEEETPDEPSDDNDGIKAEDEDAALNNGDGNGDGIPDRQQSNVASRLSSVTGKPVTLAVTGDCQTVNSFNVVSESGKDDPDYTYPHGLFEYELACAQKGQGAEVTIYLDTVYDEDWAWRKFNRFGLVYATVGERAQFGTAQVGDHTVTTITYPITDGDDLDEDGVANGIILDPSGPGVSTKASWYWWLLLPLLVIIIWMLYKKRRRHDHDSA
jgi:hypothetical protein